MKKLIILIILATIIPGVLAADPGHPAEGVSAGTFNPGDFYFNGSSILLPATPSNISSMDLAAGIQSIVTRDQIAYVGYDATAGLFGSIDFSTPSAPYLLDTVDMGGGEIEDIELLGEYALLAVDDNLSRGFSIMNISDPTSLSTIINIELASGGRDVDIYGQYALITARAGGPNLYVYDLEDINNPVQVANLTLADEIDSIAILGNYLYAGSDSTGDDLEVINITDPTNPSKVTGIDIGVSIEEVQIQGGVLYAFGPSLYVYNITNPADPTEISNYAYTGAATSALMLENFAIVTTTDSAAEVKTLDITDPASISEVHTYDTSGSARAVAVIDGKVLVGTDTTGDDLYLYDIGALQAPIAQLGNLQAGTVNAEKMTTRDLRVRESLTVGDGGFFTTGPIVTTNNISAPAICLDGDCRTTWPTGGGGSLWTNSSGDATYTVGNVGIGTSNPGYLLEVNGTITTFNNSDRAIDVDISIDPTDDDENIYSGVYSTIDITGSNTESVGDLFGLYGSATASGSGTINGVTGVYGYGGATSTVGTIIGVQGVTGPLFTSTTTAIGIDGFVGPLSGTITNAYGGRVSIRDAGGSTITNAYGLFIDEIDGTNQYGLYQNDTGATNYFAGNLLINTTTDSGYALQVDGTVNATAFIGDGSGLTNVAGGIWTNESGTATFDGDANVSGTIYYGGNLTGYGADFAERMTMAEPVEKTDVVCLQEDGSIMKCRQESDPSVAGVVSTQATIIGNAGAPNSIPVGIVGIVPTKVAGPIEPFTLLTTSTQAGVAKEADINDFGAIIGKAMEGCDQEICTIDVLVGLR